MTGRLISDGPLPRHPCDPPYGRRKRREIGDVRIGAIWRCDQCGAKWRWDWGYEMLQWSRCVGSTEPDTDREGGAPPA